MQTQYRLEVYEHTVTSVDCPVQHIICCEGIIPIS